MVPDLTLEVIYLNQPTDFKMEFDICGCCNIRFLSHLTHNKAEFLSSLGKSIVRSQVVVTVGSLNPLDAEYLPSIIGAATGYEQIPVEKKRLGIISVSDILLPKGSIPLISADGLLGGCVMESNDQAIIMLTSDRELRQEIMANLVCPYLKMLSEKKSAGAEKEKAAALVIPTQEQKTKEALLKAELPVAEKNAEEKEQLQEETKTQEEENKEETEDIEKEEKEGGPKDTNDFVVLEQPEGFAFADLDFSDFTEKNEEKPKSPKQIVRLIISVVLVLLVLLVAYFGYNYIYQPMQYSAVREETLALYGQTWHELPQNMIYKFGKLYQANKDIVGWLSIPETTINLPIVSSSGRTDSHYKTHLFDGSISSYGTPFTYSKISEDTYSRNIVIYGKGDGAKGVLSETREFLYEEKYRSAPVFSFDTIYLENHYKIISVYSVSKDKTNTEIETSFFDDGAFLSYVEDQVAKSQIETNIDITADDDLLTIVSEGKKDDIVLVARSVRDGELPLVDFDAPTTEPEDNKPLQSDKPTSSKPLQEITGNSSSKANSSEKPSAEEKPLENNSEQKLPGSSATEIRPNSSKTSSVVTSVEDDKKDTSSQENASTEKPSEEEPFQDQPSQELIDNLPVFTVKNTLDGKIITAPANEIVAQIVEAEMGSHYHAEAMKAQAVAAYSWLLSGGAATGSIPSVNLKTAKQGARDAANLVAGKVVLYNGKVAQTSYYAISAGKTANSEDIWSGKIPYLISVDSSVDKNAERFQTITTYSSTELANKVRLASGIDLTKIADKNNWFKCTYDSNGLYVKTILVGGVEKNGSYFRANVLNYEIPSTAYTISYNSNDDKFTVVVKGNGHGVGMSQVGAEAYAKSGWSYEQILKHYYKGTTLGMYTK